ncbi:hypothetical protein OHS58_02240 [Amycolatopsis sp. NBC_00348]|uniref:hypothetical protein n=1 Tax=Amycolatopsis sp. NBC_00348 TaxID=2975956 RepID=UPI002E258BBF
MGNRARIAFAALAGASVVTAGAVVVSPNTPSAFNAFTLNTVLGSYTATTFQVRAMFAQTTPKTFGQIWFTYAAYGAAATTPTTTSQPPTMTPPAPTTTPPAG